MSGSMWVACEVGCRGDGIVNSGVLESWFFPKLGYARTKPIPRKQPHSRSLSLTNCDLLYSVVVESRSILELIL